MFACFMTNTLCMGYIRTFGILFVEYRERFETSAVTTALTMGFSCGVQSITALLVHNIILEFITVRSVVAVGGFIYGINVILKVFASDITYVILTECILAGAAHGMVFSPTFVILGQYFNKYRSFATAFATCGSSLGGMLFAPMLNYLLDTEGYSGALLIYGGLMFNIIPFACLFRPLKPKEMQTDEECSETAVTIDATLAVADVGSFYGLNLIAGRSTLVAPKILSNSENNIVVDKRFPLDKNLDESISKSASVSHINKVILLDSVLQLSVQNRRIVDQEKDKSEIVTKSIPGLFLKLIRVFDFRLFQDYRFLIISAFTFFGPIAVGTGGLLLPPLNKEMGLHSTQSSNLLMVLAAVDLCSRFIIGIIADKNWIRKQNIVIISLIILGVSFQFVGFCTDFPRLVVFTVVMGLFSGAYFALLTVILIDIVGLAKLSPVLGFVQLYGGISSVAMFPLLGLLRDVTGSYVAAYQFLGATAFVTALILLMEPLVRRHRKKAKATPGISVAKIEDDD
ncbi:monocarboxylate transporter 13-like [Patella vulgata]|uniref:monocarboxylate transporter 13-like n=1 Tax=Patella vulgata TaxID=6465 RepID=UPI0024A86BED|nr:monocarboxylate transporter 13-like [Patella vulgata]